jgi:hypothetical protein
MRSSRPEPAAPASALQTSSRDWNGYVALAVAATHGFVQLSEACQLCLPGLHQDVINRQAETGRLAPGIDLQDRQTLIAGAVDFSRWRDGDAELLEKNALPALKDD